MKGLLYIVATPIGNAEDITDRARRILCEVDVVAAEDTRCTKKLFNILGIQNKTISNHKFNEKHQTEYLLSELESGRNVALVSDAGTPCISDPGGIIVKAAAEQGVNVVAVCGASSVITALSVCGFCFDSYAFYGFFPRTVSEIKKTINTARKDNIDVSVFFESPKRIKKTLQILADEVPDAELCLCNDLTKMYERIYRGKATDILDELNSNPSAEKGEYTLVVSLGKAKEDAIHNNRAQTLEAMLIDYIVINGGTLKDAVAALAQMHKGNITKKDFYTASLHLRAMFLKKQGDGSSAF
ncbi:MAG: 16S rRNA (cytidine(1402)-2'-O)-methyltransferase [Oscillospiraceae bacterium]|nr:16S rRNA (cytidine(1402)-2'-O)-methyltransferase [Oscillospiraceae bacterium]